jgi:hypothetical protein
MADNFSLPDVRRCQSRVFVVRARLRQALADRRSWAQAPALLDELDDAVQALRVARRTATARPAAAVMQSSVSG